MQTGAALQSRVRTAHEEHTAPALLQVLVCQQARGELCFLSTALTLPPGCTQLHLSSHQSSKAISGPVQVLTWQWAVLQQSRREQQLQPLLMAPCFSQIQSPLASPAVCTHSPGASHPGPTEYLQGKSRMVLSPHCDPAQHRSPQPNKRSVQQPVLMTPLPVLRKECDLR